MHVLYSLLQKMSFNEVQLFVVPGRGQPYRKASATAAAPMRKLRIAFVHLGAKPTTARGYNSFVRPLPFFIGVGHGC